MIGETKLGRGDRAYDYYKKIAPAFIEDIQELHRTEPYVYSQMIAGKDAFKPGEAKNSWLTGTAAWNYAAITQHILGINPAFKGLEINPCIPSKWDGFKVKRKFRGYTLNIEVENPNHVSKGVKEITIDGNRIEGNLIPVLEKEREYTVKVTLG